MIVENDLLSLINQLDGWPVSCVHPPEASAMPCPMRGSPRGFVRHPGLRSRHPLAV